MWSSATASAARDPVPIAAATERRRSVAAPAWTPDTAVLPRSQAPPLTRSVARAEYARTVRRVSRRARRRTRSGPGGRRGRPAGEPAPRGRARPRRRATPARRHPSAPVRPSTGPRRCSIRTRRAPCGRHPARCRVRASARSRTSHPAQNGRWNTDRPHSGSIPGSAGGSSLSPCASTSARVRSSLPSHSPTPSRSRRMLASTTAASRTSTVGRSASCSRPARRSSIGARPLWPSSPPIARYWTFAGRPVSSTRTRRRALPRTSAALRPAGAPPTTTTSSSGTRGRGCP
jgi:hypothetical protein